MIERSLIFFLFVNIVQSQNLTINGQITDKINNTSINLASIILYSYESENIEAFTSTDLNGLFTIFTSTKEGVYKLKIKHLSFYSLEKDIIITSNKNSEIKLNLSLLPKTDILEEIVIKNESPIIVKKDTIIYDISKLKDVYDTDLEQVLSKIQGFKIQANGEIEVNGKIIRKVIIDGKEISDLGSALLTKSLSPNDIKEVEVRFDEKNSKLRESLLDDGKFAVLDIKLKEDLNKSFFGNIQSNLGFQSNLKFGGYSNIFSLNKKINIQAFGENTNFGNNKISLEQIRNIGEEANAKMFSLPIDYNEVKKRKGLNNELYGFNNFIHNDNSIFGLSINFAINEKTDLFIGSFNNYHFMKNNSFTNQFYINDLINSLDLTNTQIEYNSKNKIQLKHTSEKVKLKTDLNYTWFENKLDNLNIDQNSNNFINNHNSSNIYFNNSLEYVITNKTGLVSNVSFSNENYVLNNNLKTTNSNIANILGSSISQSLFLFDQTSLNNEQNFITELKINQKTKFGNHFLGYKYYSNSLENEKKSINSTASNFAFLNPKQKLSYFINSLIYNYQNAIGQFSMNTNFELSHLNFPNSNSTANYFQYNTNVAYSPNESTNITLIVSNNLGKFPLEKMINGLYLSNFQTVFEPSNNIMPTFNSTYSMSYFKVLKELKLEINSAILYGKAQNLDNQFFLNNIIVQQANQLNSSYTAFSTTLVKNFKSFPFKITIEPEILNNQSDFIFNNQIKKNFSERYLLGFKMDSKLKGNYDFNYLTKYSKFIFKNNISDFQNNLEFISNSLTVKTNFIDKSLICISTFRTVYFFSSKDRFTNIDFSISKKAGNLNFNVVLSNLLNANTFITKDFNQVIFTANENFVFSRFINIGVEYKFK